MRGADDGRRAAEHERRHDDREDGQEDEAEARRVDERAQHEDAEEQAEDAGTEPLPACPALHPCRAPYGARYRETRVSTPICASRCHSGSSWARAVCASAHSRSASSGRARAPALSSSACAKASASARHGHGLRPRAQARQVGRHGAPAQAGVLEDPVGQGGVVERLDLERHDAHVGAQDQARGGLVLHAPQPHEVRRRAAEGEVRVVPALVLVPLADEQQHEPVAEALARPRAAAPSRCASRGGRSRWRRRRRPAAPGRSRRRAAR